MMLDSLSVISTLAFLMANIVTLTFTRLARKANSLVIAGAMIISLVFFVVLVSSHDLLFMLIGGTGLVISTGLFLPFSAKTQTSAEIAMKYSIMALIWFLLMAASVVFSYVGTHSLNLDFLNLSQNFSQVSASCLLLAFCLWLGIPPFLAFTIDTADSKSALCALGFLGRLLAATVIFCRFFGVMGLEMMPLNIQPILTIILASALLIPVLRASDQVTVRRTCLYLILPTPIVAFSILTIKVLSIDITEQFALMSAIIALAVPATLGLLSFWQEPQEQHSWEEFAGSGRKYPILGFFFIFAIGTIVGLPGTLGFILRIQVMRYAYTADRLSIAIAIGLSTIMGAATVIKLGIFLYSKPASYQMLQRHRIVSPHGLIAALVLLAIANLYYYASILI